MKAAVYMRVSTKAQELAGQRQVIQRWLEGHGVEDCQWCIDHGVSGATLDRPAMKDLQHRVFMGEVDTIIVYALDRLARNAVEGMVLIAEWLKRGIRLVVVTMDMDFSGDVGQMIASLLLHIAQMERNRMLDRQEAGLDVKRQQIAEIVEMDAGGASIDEIAIKTKVRVKNVRTCLRRGGKAWWGGGISGPKTKRGAERAYAYRQAGCRHRDIARLLEVSTATVRRYLKAHEETLRDEQDQEAITAAQEVEGSGTDSDGVGIPDGDIHTGDVPIRQRRPATAAGIGPRDRQGTALQG